MPFRPIVFPPSPRDFAIFALILLIHPSHIQADPILQQFTVPTSITAQTPNPPTRQMLPPETPPPSEIPPTPNPPAPTPDDPTEKPLQHFYDATVSKLACDTLFWKKVQVAGYLNQSYTYNFNRPADRINSYRAFDRKHNAYLFNNFQLSAYAESTTESRLGFGIKLNSGEDTKTFIPYHESTADYVDIYELWASYLVNDNLLLKAGKMPAIVGFEVEDEKDNYNISRGLLWSYLQPVTNTGARVVYTDPAKFYDLTFGVNRGWDVFRRDNNDGLTYEARVGLNPTEKLSWALAALHGPETEKNTANKRTLLDLTATYKFNDKLTGGLNADLRLDDHASPRHHRAPSAGIGTYLKYDINEKNSVAARLEALNDHGAAATGTHQNIGDLTLTAEHKFRKNLIGRIELRHDQSNDSVFTQRTHTSTGQNTIAASLTLTF